MDTLKLDDNSRESLELDDKAGSSPSSIEIINDRSPEMEFSIDVDTALSFDVEDDSHIDIQPSQSAEETSKSSVSSQNEESKDSSTLVSTDPDNSNSASALKDNASLIAKSPEENSKSSEGNSKENEDDQEAMEIDSNENEKENEGSQEDIAVDSNDNGKIGARAEPIVNSNEESNLAPENDSMEITEEDEQQTEDNADTKSAASQDSSDGNENPVPNSSSNQADSSDTKNDTKISEDSNHADTSQINETSETSENATNSDTESKDNSVPDSSVKKADSSKIETDTKQDEDSNKQNGVIENKNTTIIEEDKSDKKEASHESNDSSDTTKKSDASVSQDVQETNKTEQKKKETKTCAECGSTKRVIYQVLYQGKKRFLCSNNCFKAFRSKQKLAKTVQTEKCGQCNGEVKNGFTPPIGDNISVCSETCLNQYFEKKIQQLDCGQCKQPVNLTENGLSWEGIEFCGENCVGEMQAFIGSKCTCCKFAVPVSSLGKYSVRFGMEIRQFCSAKCLEEFKKGLKVCAFCQKDISKEKNSFLAPVGDKGQFKDFCNNICQEKYEKYFKNSNTPSPDLKCFACNTLSANTLDVSFKNSNYPLCDKKCLAQFCFTKKITQIFCDACQEFYELPKKNPEKHNLLHSGSLKNFCTKSCLNLFILTNRKIVPCTWCKVKKYNSDMVTRQEDKEIVQHFCSLNCFSQFRVNTNAAPCRKIFCDHCLKWSQAQYHLTMSDASIRNFCSYPCVLTFQAQFNVPTLTTTASRLVTPVGNAVISNPPTNSNPVISSVMTLAPNSKPQLLPKLTSIASKANLGTSPIASSPQVIREVIVRPPPPKPLKNKSSQCKPINATKGVSCKPSPIHKSCQTDNTLSGVIPIPIPIFVPYPFHMFNRTVPAPLPFPVPLPLPVFIPTPHKNFQHINNCIKEIQESLQEQELQNDLSNSLDNEEESSEHTGKGLKRKRQDQSFEIEPTKKIKEGRTDFEELKSFMSTCLRWQYGVTAFTEWLEEKNKPLSSDEALNMNFISISQEDLCKYLCSFVEELRRPNGLEYSPDVLYYLCLGIQSHITDNNRVDNIFSDRVFEEFTASLYTVLDKNSSSLDLNKENMFIVNEEILWSTKELGVHSPPILLNTILYFNSKYFFLKTIEDHQKLTFSQITKRFRTLTNTKNTEAYITYTPPNQDKIIYDQVANLENPMRCPIKFYEFYLSKIPENVKTPDQPFYLSPIRDCKPDSPVWFSTDSLNHEAIGKMLARIKFVKELY